MLLGQVHTASKWRSWAPHPILSLKSTRQTLRLYDAAHQVSQSAAQVSHLRFSLNAGPGSGGPGAWALHL